MRTVVALFSLLVAACANGPGRADDAQARATFDRIETALLDASVLRVDYSIKAAGALSAALEGDLVAQQPARASVRAAGTFAGAATDLRFVADGKRMRGGSAQQSFDEPVPVALHEGLLVGLLRMGVLHNLAVLSGGARPDWTDGSIRDHVVAHSFAFGRDQTQDESVASIAYALDVNGSPAGEVKLWYDTARHLPLRREQVVHFEAGDMRVEEMYRIEVDGMIGPCRFDVAALDSQD